MYWDSRYSNSFRFDVDVDAFGPSTNRDVDLQLKQKLVEEPYIHRTAATNLDILVSLDPLVPLCYVLLIHSWPLLW